MITIPHRRLFALITLALVFLAGVCYDTLAIQTHDRVRLLLVACTAAGLATLAILQRYPRSIVQPVLVAAWPLHLYSAAFVGVCVVFHGGQDLDQIIVYTILGYATYFLVPLVFLLDQRFFRLAVGVLAVISAALAIPTFAGAMGMDNFLGLPLRNKATYANWSGIIASGGIFEHPEGNAYQMAIGILCALYSFVVTRRPIYAVCLLFSSTGLAISQGRAAILGCGVAFGMTLVPEIFRRSRIVFFSTLLCALVLPFLILTTLATIPGIAGYLRVERGLSGRDEAWKFALSVIEDKPWVGHGFMASSELTETEAKALHRAGFSGGGTTFHNTFITKAVDLGLVVTCIYSLLYLVPLSHICRRTRYPIEETLLRSMLILILTTSIFRDYNVGGIRSTTMIGTIFLGLGNLWKFNELWELDWITAETAPSLPEIAQTSSQPQFGDTT